MSERDKMIAGEYYDAFDQELTAGRTRARDLVSQMNAELDEVRRFALCVELFASFGEGAYVEVPFFCDYGDLTEIGPHVFMNANCVILDCAPVTIGARTQIGPACQLLAADHPREIELRARHVEMAKPVTIGEDVWLGAGAIVCPGVTVGAGSIIGAGSIVNRDVPAGVVAAGNPCRVIREIEAG
jgi:maltose O-acetyltransferase